MLPTIFSVCLTISPGDPAESWRATVGLTSEYDHKAPVPNVLREGPGKMVGLPCNCLSVHTFICSFIRHLSSTCEPSGAAEMMDMWSLLFSAHTRAHTYTGRLVPHAHLPSHLTWRPQLSAQRRQPCDRLFTVGCRECPWKHANHRREDRAVTTVGGIWGPVGSGNVPPRADF